MSTPVSSTVHGTWFCFLAVLYSACQVCGWPAQSLMLVLAKPLRALACMYPLWWLVTSRIFTRNPLAGSLIDTLSTSPGRIRKVCASPKKVPALGSCGAGGPGGTPLACT
jgi:hypothetical protein